MSKSVILSFRIFKTPSHPNHKNLGPESLRHFSSPPVCHMKHVSCQVSGVTCQVSHVTSNFQTVRAKELKFREKVNLLPPVTFHMLHVTSHMSHITILVFFLCFLTKWWSYLVEGLFSAGPTHTEVAMSICVVVFLFLSSPPGNFFMVDWRLLVKQHIFLGFKHRHMKKK